MNESPHVVDEDTQQALDIAAALIAAGVPVFAAAPCPAATGEECSITGHSNGKTEYHLPLQWQKTVPSTVWLEKWRPGWALGAVGGHTADFLDEDPRSGGEASIAELSASGHMPRVYGVQETPSGGRHYLIAPLGEREANGFMLGLDYQGGTADGTGRAFVWIAPTVRRSKSIDHVGERRPYRWAQPPDLEWLGEGGDESGEFIIARLRAAREKKTETRQHDSRAERAFTESEARAFCDLTLKPLMQAQIGQIEERANAAAVQLSHFVPDFWTAETAYAVLGAALEQTAYDPTHPAAGWTADKFLPVLRGDDGRAPDDWKAVRRAETQDEAVAGVEPDEVSALIAEMLHPDQLTELPPPRHLIRGLLTLDSESWIIGEPGSRKSFVALDMAGHVARGLPWQELEVEQGRVVFIVAEGAAGIGSRMKAWEKTYGAMDPGRDCVWVLPRPVQARDLKRWAVLVKACERLKPALVVIDTQARVTVGLKENDATDMGFYIEAVRAVREVTGACVLTIHHTGRQGGDARGSSAIDGAQSTELKVLAASGLKGTLKVEKQKDLEELPDIPLKFNVVDVGVDDRGKPVTSLVLAADAWQHDEIEPGATDPDEGYQIGEPGEWSKSLVRSANARLQRLVLQYLFEVAGQHGRIESKIKAAVEARRGKFRDEQEWGRVWVAGVCSLTMPEGTEYAGEPVVSRVAGDRFGLHASLVENGQK